MSAAALALSAAGAALLAALAYVLVAWIRGRPIHRRRVTAGIGVALTLGSVGMGLTLLHTTQRSVPEQRGIGVVTSVPPIPGRGLAMSAGVRFRSCDEPVDVTLAATGTAEFWIDNARRLRREGTIQVSIPDRELEDVSVGLGEEGQTSGVAPLSVRTEARQRLIPLPVRVLRSVTVVGARIPQWGVHLRPVVVRFRADWLEPRGLGNCYLWLPALSGFATVLSAQEIRGRAVPDVSRLPGDQSIVVVSSRETGLEAYYQPEYETTRGVTSIAAGSNLLRTDLSQPAPDTNVRGAASWTCSSSPPRSADVLERIRGRRAPDIVIGEAEDATGALSVTRLGTAIGERSCASYAVVEESQASVSRDIVLLFVGAGFSLGIGFVVESLRRRRQAGDDEAPS